MALQNDFSVDSIFNLDMLILGDGITLSFYFALMEGKFSEKPQSSA
jgi:hypothetical protein